MKYKTTVNGQAFEIEIKGDGLVFVNGEERAVDFRSLGNDAIFSMILDHQSFEAVVDKKDPSNYEVLIAGDRYEVSVTDERSERLAKARGASSDPTGEVSLKSPMPGTIVKVPVEPGQEVKKGQTLVILESMKMENELKAPRDGVVGRVEVKAGQSVEQNKVLVTVQ
jgi:biotin carboxyl carrier protein